MKALKRSLLLLLPTLLFGSMTAHAQTVLDGPYIKEHTKTKKVVPYAHLREADVFWSKRIWRVVDLREKVNHPLYYPTKEINDRKCLFDVIKQAIMTDGSIAAYYVGVDGQDDEFTQVLSRAELEEIFVSEDTVWTEDLDTGEFISELVRTELESSDIKQYRLKEDWFFDKQRSKMDVRIIGIAPMKEMRNEDGEFLGFSPIFWLYFPECRYVFANWDVFNRNNDAERRSFEDIFWKRQFNSYIIKESNVYDRYIVEYKQGGIDALLESERIKEEIFVMEHDLWNF